MHANTRRPSEEPDGPLPPAFPAEHSNRDRQQFPLSSRYITIVFKSMTDNDLIPPAAIHKSTSHSTCSICFLGLCIQEMCMKRKVFWDDKERK